MTDIDYEKLWRIAEQRFNQLDWPLSMTREEIAALREQLPQPEQDEAPFTWLRRVLVATPEVLVSASDLEQVAKPFAEYVIIRYAAADGKETQDFIEEKTTDRMLQLSSQKQGEFILVKIKSLNAAFINKKFAKRPIEITSTTRMAQGIHPIRFMLNASGDGEIFVQNNTDNHQLLFGTTTSVRIKLI